LSYSGNLLVENRNGLIVDAEVFQANGTAETRCGAGHDGEGFPARQPLTVGGDKGFDTFGFVEECRHLRVTPARGAETWDDAGGSAIDGPHHAALGLRPSARRRGNGSKSVFGWLKTIALMRKVRHRGVSKVHWIFTPGLRRLQSGAHAKTWRPQFPVG